MSKTVASGLELKDITKEFMDISQDMLDVAFKFAGVNIDAKGEGSTETFYDGKAQKELAAAMDSLMGHFFALSEYYGFCQQYTGNAFEAMMQLDETIASQIGGLSPREQNFEFDSVESREDYLKKQAERQQTRGKAHYVE